MKTHWVLVLLLCTSIAFSKTILANSKFAKSIVNSLTAGTKSKTPKPAKSSVAYATDTDLDGVTDDLDLDDDNDGIPDTAEGYCNTQSVYTLNLASTLAGATFGANGGSFNLVYTLTSGTAVPSVGSSFTVPFSYSDLNNSVNAQNHTWESFGTSGSNFNIVPNVTSLYTGVPANNTQAENVTAASPGTPDGWFRYLLGNNSITKLGTFTTTIGNLPTVTGLLSSYSSNTALNLYSTFNASGAGGTLSNGYYAKMQLQNTANTASGASTVPLSASYGSTYTWDYTALTTTPGSGTGNASRGLITIVQNTVTFCNHRDTDSDGIPDYLDLDSDGDGCPDAVEGGGGFTNANLVTATGSLATQSPNKNLGNTVGSTATTMGIPTIAGTGQNIGVSQNSNVNACTDSDGDGITNVYDLDNDNDGILDVNEKTCPLTGQTIRIGYIPNSRDLDGDTGYTFDGSLMSGSGALKLTNPANFGPNGAVNANIVLVNMGTAPITKAIINSLNLNAIFLGGINDAAATPNSYLSAAEFDAIKDWSDDSQNNYVVSTQAQTQPWGTSVVSQVSNPNVPTSYGSQTSIFKGPFGKVTSFTQGGGYQGYFSTINALFGANALAVNGSNGPVMYVDGTYNDLMIADVDILTTVGGITAGSSVTSNNDVLFMNIWAFVAEQSACTSYKDTDGDGIPDYLDLDSDGDSCPDAVEGGGGFTNANLVTATGSLATQNPNQNLGNNVGSNGVPTIAGAGQNIGVSQNSNVNACTDSDGDGITNVYDLDNDNDGILDLNEKTCPLTGQTIRIGYIPDSRSGNNGYTFNGSQMSGSGALKLTNPANFGPSGTVKANIVLVDMGTAPITKAIINSLNLNAIFLGGIDNLTTSYLSAGEFKAIKDWSDDSQNNYVVSTQIQTQFWDTSVVSQVSNPNVPTSYGSQTSIFKGPFGTVASFNQAGGYQGYFSAVNSSFGTNALAVNGSNGPVMYVDGIYNDLMIADVDILTALGGVTAGSGVTSNNDKLFMNIWAFVAEQSVCTSYKDTDGDGIPDYLDLDSDGDSCPDAIEGGGGFTSANLVTATGSLATQNPNQNLGNNVGSNGVPTIAGAGQSVGNSTNALVNLCFCYKTPVSPGGGNPNPVKFGITALNRAGSGSSEWPEVRRSAWAALESKSKGFVVNRMAFVDADSNPATPTTPPLASIPAANYVEGMMVYDTVANCLKIYNGTVWSCYSTQTCPD
ncbi:beta strand repeat-containing protein [Chryseobacterium sp. MYb7]|uniref:beta strand repeat-containing protein n=1 Tax=Chryseobacterium sp. MYb7 TaxID=1827290 RepID=UPI0013FE0968|nr:thrombospondin type 3 repeat-containing protein [Chryseobacterium sp. MYb7]